MEHLFEHLETAPTLGDVCARKHGGVETSVEAFERVKVTGATWRRLVLEAIRAAGEAGMTLDELSAKFEIPVNCISGRCTELAKLGKIFRTQEKRLTRRGSPAFAWKAYPRAES